MHGGKKNPMLKYWRNLKKDCSAVSMHGPRIFVYFETINSNRVNRTNALADLCRVCRKIRGHQICWIFSSKCITIITMCSIPPVRPPGEPRLGSQTSWRLGGSLQHFPHHCRDERIMMNVQKKTKLHLSIAQYTIDSVVYLSLCLPFLC